MIGYSAIFISLFFMAIGWAVSARLKSKFKKYGQIPLAKNLSGAEVARLMLADNGIYDVQVIAVDGELSDHYSPAAKTVNLSPDVFDGRSVSAAAVAAHECGHAVQHAQAYAMLNLRTALVPIQSISSKVLNFMFMAMMFGSYFVSNLLPWNTALMIIIACYAAFALFAVVTLPVEFDASRRALAWIKTRNIVEPAEHDMAKDALKWAAMTYVVAAIGAITILLYYVSQFLGNRN